MAETPSGFTVKEILTEIVIPDLKAIKSSLDLKAERSEMYTLEGRVEANTKRLDTLPFEYQQHVASELKAYDQGVRDDSERRFSRRDKLLIGSLGFVTALAAVASTIVMFVSAAAGGG